MAVLARVPDLGGARARRLRGPLGTAAVLGLATLALRVRDPHEHGSWGLCPFKAITGWDCPFCGGLRAVNDLGHGRLVDAAQSNLVLVASIPLIVGLWLLWTRRSWSGDKLVASPGVARASAIGVAALAVAFTIYRNTPWGSALQVS
jgi:hypothetical protein